MKAHVMKRAWEIAKKAVKKFGGKVKEFFAQALKMAWAEVKDVKEVFTGYARVTVDGYTLSFKAWEKYGKKRIYINEVKGQEGQREQTTGAYIENGEVVKGTGYEAFNATVNAFLTGYEF